MSKGSGRKIRNALLERKPLWMLDLDTTPSIGNSDVAPGRLSDPILEKHRESLVCVMDLVRGLRPPSIRDPDLVNWFHGGDDPIWPVSKGHVYRAEDGALRFDLTVESMLEWRYLRQHLPQDPMWCSAEVAKEMMVDDITARERLFGAVVECIVNLNDLDADGCGGRISIISDWGFGSVETFEVTTYYIFALFEHAFASALKVAHRLCTREDFRMDVPDILSLDGIPAIRSKVPRQRDCAVDLFLKAQESIHDLPEAQTAAAYQSAVEATDD